MKFSLKRWFDIPFLKPLVFLVVVVFSGEAAARSMKADITVAKDGSGDFTSVQAAINAAPSGRTEPFVIFIKKGIYKELIDLPKGKDFITFQGEEAATTVITFDNSARKLDRNGKEYGTSKSATVFIKADHFTASKITFENSAGITAGQALAINITGNWAAFKNCRFLGHQDTFFANNGTTQYLKDCYLAGTVDFIFGGSTALFERCTMHSLGNGYVTAASTPQGQAYGYVFINCKLTATKNVQGSNVYLGRPWRAYAKVVFIETDMDEHIKPEGWHNWGKTENEKTATYSEYRNKGAGFQPEKRVAWARILTEIEAKEITKKKILGSWRPF